MCLKKNYILILLLVKRNGNNMETCLFCKIINREISSEIVWESEELLAFKDLNSVAPAHILLVPKKHVAGISSLKPEHEVFLGKMFLAAQEIARQEGISEDGFRVVVNNGKQANQTIFHLHLHILGGRKMSWPPG